MKKFVSILIVCCLILVGLVGCYPRSISSMSIILSEEEIYLDTNEEKLLAVSILPVEVTSRTVFWTSSDMSVATVTDGTVRGIKEGETIITAINGISTDTCKVYVVNKTRRDYLARAMVNGLKGEIPSINASMNSAATLTVGSFVPNPTRFDLAGRVSVAVSISNYMEGSNAYDVISAIRMAYEYMTTYKSESNSRNDIMSVEFGSYKTVKEIAAANQFQSPLIQAKLDHIYNIIGYNSQDLMDSLTLNSSEFEFGNSNLAYFINIGVSVILGMSANSEGVISLKTGLFADLCKAANSCTSKDITNLVDYVKAFTLDKLHNTKVTLTSYGKDISNIKYSVAFDFVFSVI